jgi:DNA-directed RNA polymerase subunit RPC12/RpoP
MARRNWYECRECGTTHCGAFAGAAMFVCPECSSTAIALKPRESVVEALHVGDVMPAQLRQRQGIDALAGLRARFLRSSSLSADADESRSSQA